MKKEEGGATGDAMQRTDKSNTVDRVRACEKCGKRMTDPYIGDRFCYHCLSS